MPASPYDLRASASADMAKVLAGIDNRGPDGAGLVAVVPAPAPTVLTEDELAEVQSHIHGTPQGPTPIGGIPSGGGFYVRGTGGA